MRKHDSEMRDVICHDCHVHFPIFSFLMNIVGFLSSVNFKIILNELIRVRETEHWCITALTHTQSVLTVLKVFKGVTWETFTL